MAAVRVRIASQLYSYTGGLKVVEVEAATVWEAIAALDRRFPGLAFRVIDEQSQIRPHINIFLGEEKVRDLAAPIPTARKSGNLYCGSPFGGLAAPSDENWELRIDELIR